VLLTPPPPPPRAPLLLPLTTRILPVICHADHHLGVDLTPCAEFTSDTPLKPPMLASMKSTNYLLNAHTVMDAAAKAKAAGVAKGYMGLMVDRSAGEGREQVAELSVSAVGFVTQEGRFISPRQEKILASTTVRELWEGALPVLVERGVISSFGFEEVALADVPQMREMLGIGAHSIWPITSLDGQQVGDGSVGAVVAALKELLEDASPQGRDSWTTWTDVPYAGSAEQRHLLKEEERIARAGGAESSGFRRRYAAQEGSGAFLRAE